MGLSASPAMWQQLINKVFENISNKERYKIITHNTIVFSGKDKHFVDLANLSKELMKFG